MLPILPLFLRAFVLGFAVAVPLGPTGATAVRFGLSRGAWASFGIGLGAALTDFIYIVGVYAGLTRLLAQFTWLPVVLYTLGAVVLGRMGLQAVRSALASWGTDTVLDRDDDYGSESFTSTKGSWRATVVLGIAITVVNPATITSWLSIGGAFVASSLTELSPATSLCVMLGVMIGSATWFSILALGVGLTRTLTGGAPQLFRTVTVASGVLLLVFAAFFLEQGVKSLLLLR